jgi:hypothetical protein
MALILKRASQAAHPASGTMTIKTCAATVTITTEAQRMTTSRRWSWQPTRRKLVFRSAWCNEAR